MNEDDLRAAFARHEAEAPDVEELHASIDREVRRRRRRRTGLLAGGLAGLVALAIAVPVWLVNRGDTVPGSPLHAAATATEGPKKDLNLLLLGLDTRAGWAAEKKMSRSDTIIIVHIPADRTKIYTVSIARDLLAEIPGFGKDKINAAFVFGQRNGGSKGGLSLVEQTLTRLSGLTFDGGAVLEMTAAKQITDVLGGVPMCVERDTWSSHYINKNGRPEYYSYNGQDRLPNKLPNSWIHTKGCRTMAGWEALDYVRQRDGLPNADYDRQRNTQRYLVGLAQKVSELNLLTDAGKIAALAQTKGVTVDLGGISVPELALQLRGIKAEDVVSLSLANTFVRTNGSPVVLGEGMTPEGKDLLAALKNETLAEFAAAHPDLVLQR